MSDTRPAKHPSWCDDYLNRSCGWPWCNCPREERPSESEQRVDESSTRVTQMSADGLRVLGNVSLEEARSEARSSEKERRSTDDYYGDLARQRGDAYALMVACDEIDKLRSATQRSADEPALLEAALSVMEEWDEGLDQQDGKEYENACKDWNDCLAALREWKRLRSIASSNKVFECLSDYPSEGRCAPCKSIGYCIAHAER